MSSPTPGRPVSRPVLARLAALGAAALLALIAATSLYGGTDARGGTSSVEAETFVSGDDGETPVFSAAAPGVEDRLYVVFQQGFVRSYDLATGEAEPFLDISGLISSGGERGLLSIAFAPDFADSRRLYAYFTNRTGDIEVAEFRAPTDLTANPDSRRRVITVRHRANGNHNGGTAMFGPDGLLYLGTGDGGGAGDPAENAQDRTSLLGKLLRIDPRPTAKRAYRVPRSNPFAGERRGRGEILALGLRNPFRFSFDGPVAWIGDVGQGAREEIDRAAPARLDGANLGWDRWEGTRRFRSPGDPSARTPKARNHVEPRFEYSHARGCSITGGVVARDPAVAALDGRFLYADFCEGRLRSIATAPSGPAGDRDEGLALERPSSFAIGPDGVTYVTLLGGRVVRLVAGSG